MIDDAQNCITEKNILLFCFNKFSSNRVITYKQRVVQIFLISCNPSTLCVYYPILHNNQMTENNSSGH
jgi:hypothetical protein